MFITSCNPKPCEEPPPPRGTTSAPGICARKGNIRLVPGQGGQREMTWKAQNIPSVPNPLGIQREGRLSLRHRWVRAGAEGQSPTRAGVPQPPAPVTGAKAAGMLRGCWEGAAQGRREGRRQRSTPGAAARAEGTRSPGGLRRVPPAGPAPPGQPGRHSPCRGRCVSPGDRAHPRGWRFLGEGVVGAGSRSAGLRCPPTRCPPRAAIARGDSRQEIHRIPRIHRIPGGCSQGQGAAVPGSRGTAPLLMDTRRAPPATLGGCPGPEPVPGSGAARDRAAGRGTAPQGTDHLARAGAAPAAFGILGMVLSLEHSEAVQAPGWNETRAGSLGWAAREKEQNEGEEGLNWGHGESHPGEPRDPPWHPGTPVPQHTRHRPPAASARCPFSWHHLEAAGTGTGGQTQRDGDGQTRADRHKGKDTHEGTDRGERHGKQAWGNIRGDKHEGTTSGQTWGTDTLPQHPRVLAQGAGPGPGGGAVTEQGVALPAPPVTPGSPSQWPVLEVTGYGICVPMGWRQTEGQAGDNPHTPVQPTLKQGSTGHKPQVSVPRHPPSREAGPWATTRDPGPPHCHPGAPSLAENAKRCHLWPDTGWMPLGSSESGLGCGTGVLGILCTPTPSQQNPHPGPVDPRYPSSLHLGTDSRELRLQKLMIYTKTNPTASCKPGGRTDRLD